MIPKIKVTAVYETYFWENPEDEWPIETSGYTDPMNPWGGFKTETPPGLVGAEFSRWRDENVTTVEFDTGWEAAEFILDFSGGVWDYSESESEEDYRTGVWTQVTLFVQDDQEWIFNLCDTIADLRGRRRQRAVSH
jgi:hypothetical protein